MNTEDAKELLKQAEHDPGCNADEPGGDCCPGCGYVTAVATIQNMARPTLRVAIKLAEAAQHSADEDCSCKARQALAEWKALAT